MSGSSPVRRSSGWPGLRDRHAGGGAADRDARPRAAPGPRPARTAADRGQGLRLPRVRGGSGLAGCHAATAVVQAGEGPTGRAVTEVGPPTHL
ncbi:hypothetical protein FH609_018490 [Streptomyces sp. 3MP-14]|uniref:Uncharacterized protein n=1 Tax=Streptomyces mimosae TaxID=2586635 RepID=A0A5N6A9R7_9ACTN|nr:hypothetical protein FH607_015815 [Streptomyces mimosae]KAB8175602.1 hypothetical protein FH609_018490 [Streptomyces sp. 3MP-14]